MRQSPLRTLIVLIGDLQEGSHLNCRLDNRWKTKKKAQMKTDATVSPFKSRVLGKESFDCRWHGAGRLDQKRSTLHDLAFRNVLLQASSNLVSSDGEGSRRGMGT